MKNLWYLQQGITLKYSNWNWYHFCTCPHHLRFLYHNCRTSWQGLMLTSTNPHQSFFLLKKCKIILCGWQTDGQDPFWQSLDYRSASSCWSLGYRARCHHIVGVLCGSGLLWPCFYIPVAGRLLWNWLWSMWGLCRCRMLLWTRVSLQKSRLLWVFVSGWILCFRT